MVEYIDKDKLLNDIECIEISCCTDIDDIFTEVERTIDEQPTADVQEVRHGKNITKIKPVDEFECSECGFICEICENIYYDDCICHREYNPEFCPNCGAKMDGKEDEE